MGKTGVSVTETTIGRALRGLTMENDLISTTLVLDQGADIVSLFYKPRMIEAMYQAPWQAREPGVGAMQAVDQFTEWCQYFRGGWSLLFPNLGAPVSYKGATLDRHGEAARTVWQLEDAKTTAKEVSITVATSLLCLPFRIKRVLTLRAGIPVLEMQETVTNEGLEPMDCLWFDQPLFGQPLLSPDSFIDTGAHTVWTDDGLQAAFDEPGIDLPPGQTWTWPEGLDKKGSRVDLSRVPPYDPSSGHTRLVILRDFVGHWIALTNPTLGIGVGIVWDGEILPYAYLYQETGGWRNYPYFGRAYMMGLAPASSYPTQGLDVVRGTTGTQLTLAAGESRVLMLRVVFYEGAKRVSSIDLQGAIVRR